MINRISWVTVTGQLLLWFVLLWMTFRAYNQEWIPIVDDANLIFHEAGHVIFSFAGEFIMMLGGTLGQLLVPLIALFVFMQARDQFGANVALWWIGQNLVGVARYMSDARAQELPLLGERHDWFFIFDALGLLQSDTIVGTAVYWTGMVLMVLGLTFAGQKIRTTIRKLSADRTFLDV